MSGSLSAVRPTTAAPAAVSRRVAGRCRNAKQDAISPYQWRLATVASSSVTAGGASRNSATSSARARRVSNSVADATHT